MQHDLETCVIIKRAVPIAASCATVLAALIGVRPARADDSPARAPEPFHVGPMLYTSVGIGYAHYDESDSGPKPGSIKLDGPAFSLPLGIYGVQITRSIAIGAALAFHPFYAVHGDFAAGGFGGVGAVFSVTPVIDVDVILGGGGIGVSKVFGGSGPAASVGGTFYLFKLGRFSLGPQAHLSIVGIFVNYPGGDTGTGFYLSPTVGFAGTYR